MSLLFYPSFWNPPSLPLQNRQGVRNNINSFKNLWNNIWLSLYIPAGAFLCFFECFYYCLPFSICFFVKIFFHFYDQIKHKAGNMFYSPTNNNKTMETLQTIFMPNFLGGLHMLVIREHSSGSVVSGMALYYAQYKHTKFKWRSCLGIN